MIPNRYMVSENCAINAGKQPLLRGSDTRRFVGSIDSSKWNGTTVFANGTVAEASPSGTIVHNVARFKI